MTLVTTVILGVIYPLDSHRHRAGSVSRQGQRAVDRAERYRDRIANHRPGLFFTGILRPRPSATAMPYDAANSAGSQFGPTNKKLIDAVTANVEAARKENPDAPIPVDLVTTSASGFDPHLSPAAAAFQVPRVARERGMSSADVQRLVDAHTEGRQLGFWRAARERAGAQSRAGSGAPDREIGGRLRALMAEYSRPTADALLARIQEQDRSRLRIYIGAAPGVGKTYEMLQEAHALRSRGLDVVVGFVETYGRRDTEAQLKDLEVIPRRKIEYRGVTMEEMDVDAIIHRHPRSAWWMNSHIRMCLGAGTRNDSKMCWRFSTPAFM